MKYLSGHIRELRPELLYSSEQARRSEARRLELFIPEINSSQTYPFDYVYYRITLFRPTETTDAALPGDVLRKDLQALLLDLTRRLDDPGEKTDPTLSLKEISEGFGVSRGAVDRWRRDGLVTRYFSRDGERVLGASQSVVERYITDHAEEVERARRRRPLNGDERFDILQRARRIKRQGIELPRDIARKIAAETSGVASAILRVLKEHEDELGLDATDGRQLAPEEEQELTRRYRKGVPVSGLCKKYHLSRSAVYRVIQRVRLRAVLDTKVRYIPSDEFEAEDAEERILGEEGVNFEFNPPAPASRLPKAPPGLPGYLRELYRIAILTREQEREIFRVYNYVKYRMVQAQELLRSEGYQSDLADEFETLRGKAGELKHALVRRNLRLVVSVAKRHLGPAMGLFELISEGNLCLMRTVECFDYNRGARFSTYATWALTKHFARVVPETSYKARSLVTGQEELIQNTGDVRVDATEADEELDFLRVTLTNAISRLRPREQKIIRSRFGLDESQTGGTLEEIAQGLGVTRERIRQIEKRALEKLRWFLGPEVMELAGA